MLRFVYLSNHNYGKQRTIQKTSTQLALYLVHKHIGSGNFMIPSNRAVIGKDLDEVRQQHGWQVNDACWVYGLSMTRWMQIVRQAPDSPVKDPTLALLVRFLDSHPDSSPIPRAPSPAEMHDLINSVEKTKPKSFAAYFGSEPSANHRWLKQGGRPSPAVSRLMYVVQEELLAHPQKQADILIAWRETVKIEGAARGNEDVLVSGDWKQAEMKEKIETSAKTATVSIKKKGNANEYHLQVGAFRTQAEALNVRDRLLLSGIESFIVKDSNSDIEIFRVREGPHVNKAEADKMRVRIEGLGFDATLTVIARESLAAKVKKEREIRKATLKKTQTVVHNPS
jgi:hypothetical protein